jgi:acyl-CoA synthetase (NDP forming)
MSTTPPVGDTASNRSTASDKAHAGTGITSDENFRALFEPRGVIVAGASSHPGKFGFSALHNILASGYKGQVFATNREAEVILGIQTLRSITEIPDGVADLVIVCTPASTNVGILKECAAKGVRAAFVTSAGYREAGPEGAVAEAELVAVAHELGMLVAGPNGQGMVSTPAALCAMIVAPYPAAGRISIASQSGNLLSSFMNYSLQSGIGMARGISAGNAACVSIGDYLTFFGTDEATAVALAYVENVDNGVEFVRQLSAVSERKPVVLVKGGATAAGSAAAASHTGALASVDRVFDGAIRSAGAVRAASVEEAYDTAASFATQPLPKGPNVAVITTAGGWGVVTADALAGTVLNLMALPDDLRAQIDTHLPPRWSRSNPIDMAGGETRETIPAVLELVAAHPDVHAIVYLGLGIQSNTARMMRTGAFYPDHGTERIVDFHERQDRIYALAAAEISARYGKPILTATELGIADPNNAGPIAVRESGRYCYPSSQRAVRALANMWWYAQWRARRNLN